MKAIVVDVILEDVCGIVIDINFVIVVFEAASSLQVSLLGPPSALRYNSGVFVLTLNPIENDCVADQCNL